MLWWVRQYLIYLVKAGHVAAMDALLQGGEIPGGQAQISYAVATVKARFLEVNVLFGIDILIRGVVRALVGLLNMLTSWIPGFKTLNDFVNAVLKVALGLVDEIILAYIIRRGDTPPAEAARDGLVLYAQNGGTMIRNAVWIVLFELAAVITIFLVRARPGGRPRLCDAGRAHRLRRRLRRRHRLGAQRGADRAALHRRAAAGLRPRHTRPDAEPRTGRRGSIPPPRPSATSPSARPPRAARRSRREEYRRLAQATSWPGLGPAIHDFGCHHVPGPKTWIPGTSPGMTARIRRRC